MVGTTCVVGSGSTGSGDPNCKKTDNNQRCQECYSGYFLSPQATCLRLDPLCKTYTPTQIACASCYSGYDLYQGQCVIPSKVPNSNSDPYCIAVQNGQCLNCASGFYLGPEKKCLALNPLCKTSDMTNGYCKDCYPGYLLAGTSCIVAADVNIPYCNRVVGQVCAECINGYYPKAGKCELVNVLCATYSNTTGACFSCVSGYVFQEGGCLLPSMGIDPYCVWYESSFCSRCVEGFALVNYMCVQIDMNCVNFDNIRNLCKECKNGKRPEGSRCM